MSSVISSNSSKYCQCQFLFCDKMGCFVLNTLMLIALLLVRQALNTHDHDNSIFDLSLQILDHCCLHHVGEHWLCHLFQQLYS